MHACDTICEMLEPAKEYKQAAKCVNHPSTALADPGDLWARPPYPYHTAFACLGTS